MPAYRSNIVRELLRQRAARTFGEDGDLRADVDARLEVRLRLAVLVDAFVAGADADDASVLGVKSKLVQPLPDLRVIPLGETP